MLIEFGQGLAGDAQGGPSGHIALGDDLIHDFLHLGAGNGEAKPLNTGSVGESADFDGVDADDLTVAVDERPAGIAGVQGGVGLNQGHGAAVDLHIPVDGGDDAVGIGAPEFHPQRIADGHHRIAYPQGFGIAELGGGQVLGINVQHRQIGHRVIAYGLGGESPVIGKEHRNFLGTADDVVIGD